MTKKSNAQIRRSQMRAEARGETYVEPSAVISSLDAPTDKHNTEQLPSLEKKTKDGENAIKLPENDKKKLEVAKQLQKDLTSIEGNSDLKAKERRAAKRKAEAIAAEEVGCSVEELLEWYQKTDVKQNENSKRKIPYIVFVGQLSYDTTAEDLFLHIKTELQEDKIVITDNNLKIRLLTKASTKESRGMAFVEVDDPETLYALLKLHHTFLKGRRMNVERSAGGGAETRKTKVSNFRSSQAQFMLESVQGMLKPYQDRGEIKKEGELDEGVISLCTRHSASIVEAALNRYVESNGRDMDNPSAYLSFLLTKLSTEGVFKDRDDKKSDDTGNASRRSDDKGYASRRSDDKGYASRRSDDKGNASRRSEGNTRKRPKF